ncbi:DUF1642 domain-containing protein [Enterococcus faecium]|nr:DUF1642 domain-containing protein [Enterococcus faecium]
MNKNKQELINELKRISLEKQHKALTHPESKNYYEGMVMAYSQVVHMVNTVLKLDEPKKPVVPQFVAEWFEENKDDLEFAIWELCVDSYGSTEQGMLNWIQQSENNPIETLTRMKDGYEVEKEPLYRVKLGEGYFVEYQGRGALIIPDGNKEIKIFDSKSDAERTAQTIGGTVEEVVEG